MCKHFRIVGRDHVTRTQLEHCLNLCLSAMRLQVCCRFHYHGWKYDFCGGKTFESFTQFTVLSRLFYCSWKLWNLSARKWKFSPILNDSIKWVTREGKSNEWLRRLSRQSGRKENFHFAHSISRPKRVQMWTSGLTARSFLWKRVSRLNHHRRHPHGCCFRWTAEQQTSESLVEKVNKYKRNRSAFPFYVTQRCVAVELRKGKI